MSEPRQLAVNARRPHNKSRNGCGQCKQRKVKCDESKPVCKKCESYGSTCSFLQTHPQSRPPTVASMLASPSPEPAAISTIPSNPSPLAKFTMLDLELLHHWTTKTVQASLDWPEGIELYRTTVVQIAFPYPFLMHELFALTATHLAHLRPENHVLYKHAADSHAATALSLFQPEIANLTPENCHACFAFSAAVFKHAWAAQDVDKPSSLFFTPSSMPRQSEIQWVKLQRGTMTILASVWPDLLNGPLNALFVPWKDLDRERPDPLPAEDEEHVSALSKAWASLPLPQREVLDGALRQTRRTLSMLVFFPSPSRLAIGISWFSHISDEFIQMLAEKVPQALLIVCYYCVALKKLGATWWMQGKTENLLRTVMLELGSRWETWTRWPMEKVFGDAGWSEFDDGGGERRA